MMRSSVDLPQPDGPTKTTNSPSFTVEVDVVQDLDRAEGFVRRFSSETSAMEDRTSFHGARGEAADELAREETVEDEHGRDRESRATASTAFQSVTYWPMNCWTPRVIGLLAAAGRKDQREPEIVPDRHHGEDGDRRHRRADEGQDDGEEDPVFADPVAARRVAQIARDLLR